MARNKFTNLTGMRGLAALWVVAVHLPTIPVISSHYSAIADKGWLGVDLFFILSGFVIAYVHQQDFQEINKKTLSNFAILRFARVYPVFVAVLFLWLITILFVSVVAPNSFPKSSYTVKLFLYQLFLLNGWGIPDSNGWNIPSWSLSSEVFAYICFPLIAFFTLRMEKKLYFLIGYSFVILLSIALAYWLNSTPKFMLDTQYTLYRVVSEFLLGVFLYNIFLKTHHSQFVSNFFTVLSFVITLLISYCSIPSQYDFCYLLTFSAMIYFGAHAQEGISKKLFSNRLMIYLGEISYSIYLIHSLVLLFFSAICKRILIPALHDLNIYVSGSIILLALLSIILSGHILFYTIEKPMRKSIRGLFGARDLKPGIVKYAQSQD